MTFGGTGWVETTTGSPYGGSLRSTSSAGRTAKTTFTGRGIAWVSTRARNRGKAEVWLDGKRVATISLHKSTTAVQQNVLGTHASGATGNRVDLDAFVILVP